MFEILICAFYAWICMPVVGAIFSAYYYNYFFISLFIIGWFGILLIYRKGKLPGNKLYLIVVLYMTPIVILAILGVGDASKTIKINAMFFLTILLYGLTKDQKYERRIAQFLIFTIILTAVTSTIGLIAFPSAGRAISRAHADHELQTSYKMMNIAGSFFYQALVMMIAPILVISQKFNKKILGYISVGFILLVLLNASFTIAIFGFCLELLCCMIFQVNVSRKKRASIFTMALVLFFVLLLRLDTILIFITDHIGSSYVSDRLIDLVYVYRYGTSSLGGNSDVLLRFNNYSSSITTFIRNPFGIGPYYSYVALDRGIGYHSQILDDLARYGLFAMVFYIVYFIQYYQMLAEQWDKLGRKDVAITSTVVWAFFLLSNIGFRNGVESAMCFYILPAIPNIILQRQGINN